MGVICGTRSAYPSRAHGDRVSSSLVSVLIYVDYCLSNLSVCYFLATCVSFRVDLHFITTSWYLLSLLRSKNLLLTISVTSVYKYCKKEIIATDQKGIYFHNK